MRRVAHLSLAVVLFFCTSRTEAQTAPNSLGLSGQTVSVASLQVPAGAREHLNKAKLAARAKREDVFAREIAGALASAPGFAEAYLVRADHENEQARYDAAAEDALKARELDPSTAWSCVVLATAYNGQARHQDAFLILANLRGEGAGSWQAAYEMGRSEVGRGNAEGALRWSRLALAAAPATFLDARLLLANAFQLAHKWKEASEEMEVYLGSSGPLMHREAVMLALQHTRLLAARDQLASVRGQPAE